MTPKRTPDWLKAWRERMELSQIAAAGRLGLSPRGYRYYESGGRPIPNVVVMAALAAEEGHDASRIEAG